MGRCIIIVAGDLTVGGIDVKEDDYVIAVDGGLEYAALLEIEPDLIIGDFDSVSEQVPGAVGYMMDGAGMTLVLRNEEVSFNANLEGYISVLALSKECKGVTMTGLKYELSNETITNSYPLGISNEFIGVKSTVKVTEGDALVVVNYVSGEEE